MGLIGLHAVLVWGGTACSGCGLALRALGCALNGPVGLPRLPTLLVVPHAVMICESTQRDAGKKQALNQRLCSAVCELVIVSDRACVRAYMCVFVNW